MALNKTFLKSLFFLSLFFLTSCATITVYNVDLKYEPTKKAQDYKIDFKKTLFAITEFNDLRNLENKNIIGKVIQSNGKEVPIVSIKERPSYGLALAFKDAFFKSGLTVSGNISKWDLKESSIKEDWGGIIIGGEIHKLELVVKEGIAVKNYEANIKLKMVIGDNRTKKIFYMPSYETSGTITDVLFSEERAQKHLNSILSSLIEKVLADRELWNKVTKEIISEDIKLKNG